MSTNANLTVFVVHGLGEPDAEYYHPLRQNVEKHSPHLASSVEWYSVNWYHLVAARETKVWKNLNDHYQLNQTRLRRYAMSVLATAVSYNSAVRDEESLYQQIQHYIREQLQRLYQGDEGQGLFLIGHSFGVQVICDYLLDCQNFRMEPRPASAFERMETALGLISLGSAQPMFELSEPDPQAPQFPNPRARELFAQHVSWEKFCKQVRWENFYEKDDVLGFPLKILSESYDKSVRADHSVQAGSLLSRWNPLSHYAYWSSDEVAKKTAEQLSQVLALIDSKKSDAKKI